MCRGHGALETFPMHVARTGAPGSSCCCPGSVRVLDAAACVLPAEQGCRLSRGSTGFEQARHRGAGRPASRTVWSAWHGGAVQPWMETEPTVCTGLGSFTTLLFCGSGLDSATVLMRVLVPCYVVCCFVAVQPHSLTFDNSYAVILM
uniref:Uncharacterized protein n=1 Tax=Setaria viridis TaxID=4556 RepID=A0A4U6SQU2_SETVI|nr:hypothetical protein SEVIR_9G036000v2 [Setaria viridis]